MTSSSTALIVSVTILFAAPLVHLIVRGHPRAKLVIDRSIFLVVTLIVVAHVLPEAFSQAQWLALIAAALGFAAPGLLERYSRGSVETIHWLPILIAAIGLGTHAIIDGVALSYPVEGSYLPLAVILHRLPVALLLWWVIEPKGGWIAAALVLCIVATLTGAGFVLGATWLAEMHPQAIGTFQGLVAGSLLHLGLHRNHPHSLVCRHHQRPLEGYPKPRHAK